eukprot:1917805-Rhodomonas_salina.5
MVAEAGTGTAVPGTTMETGREVHQEDGALHYLPVPCPGKSAQEQHNQAQHTVVSHWETNYIQVANYKACRAAREGRGGAGVRERVAGAAGAGVGAFNCTPGCPDTLSRSKKYCKTDSKTEGMEGRRGALGVEEEREERRECGEGWRKGGGCWELRRSGRKEKRGESA